MMGRSFARAWCALAAVLSLSLLAGCGRTGLEVHISVPQELKPGLDYNALRVRVDAVEGGYVENRYPLTELKTPPYVVYVYADGEVPHYQVSVRAELWQDNALKKTKLAADVPLDQGDVTALYMAFD
jgi:hypothetical protein